MTIQVEAPPPAPAPAPIVRRSKPKHQLLKRLRAKAYVKQRNRCYWCGKTNLRQGGSDGEWHPDTLTAEHLVRREDGGLDTAENVVAACAHCNSDRERRPDGIPHVRVKAISRPRVVCEPAA